MSSENTDNIPSWKQEYPVKQSEEHKTSRRTFAKFLGLSLVTIAGGYAIKDTIFKHVATDQRKAVAKDDELGIGDHKLFNFPTHEPCILIRLSESEYVAYSQSCTHLMCPVHYNKDDQQLVCPCHEGYFDAKDGSVLAGPPPRALPKYNVSIEEGQIIVG